MDSVINFVTLFAASHPYVTTILLVMGTLRAIFKPLTFLAEAYVKSTPDTKDDETLAEVENSKLYKGFAFVLDYLASVKLIK